MSSDNDTNITRRDTLKAGAVMPAAFWDGWAPFGDETDEEILPILNSETAVDKGLKQLDFGNNLSVEQTAEDGVRIDAAASGGSGAVDSVFGRDGDVTANADDYDEFYAPLEEGVGRGPIADRPDTGPYDDYLYVATDQGVTWRWDESASDWSVLDHGSTDQPLPEGHYESLNTEQTITTLGGTDKEPANRPLVSNEPRTIAVGTDTDTIQEALDMVPRILRHEWVIDIPSGTYDEDLYIAGVQGLDLTHTYDGQPQGASRALKIKGDDTAPSNVEVSSIFIASCSGNANPAVDGIR